jgi:hypothetical protein
MLSLFSAGLANQLSPSPVPSNGPSAEALLAAWFSVIVVSVLFAAGMTGSSFQQVKASEVEKRD